MTARTETATGMCRTCQAPAPLDNQGVIAAHREQIVTAHGWGDGYNPCRGKGSRPAPSQPQGDPQ